MYVAVYVPYVTIWCYGDVLWMECMSHTLHSSAILLMCQIYIMCTVRHQAQRSSSSSGSQINISFGGLVAALQVFRGNSPYSSSSSVSSTTNHSNTPPRTTPVVISIQDFAARYMLSQSIQDKLIAMQLGGAHVLHKISNDALGSSIVVVRVGSGLGRILQTLTQILMVGPPCCWTCTWTYRSRVSRVRSGLTKGSVGSDRYKRCINLIYL